MAVAKKQGIQVSGRRKLVAALVLCLTVYLVVTQRAQFDDVGPAIMHAQRQYLALGVLLLSGTFMVAGLLYRVLALKKLQLGQAIVVQVAGMFAGRILPAGLGAIGVSYDYLRHNKHTAAEAEVVVAVNNILGFVGNVLLVLTLLAVRHEALPSIQVPKLAMALMVGLTVVLFAGLLIRPVRQKVVKWAQALHTSLARYRDRPLQLVTGLGLSILLTAMYAAMLSVAALATGQELSFVASCIIMSVGVIGATVTPTPGGLGGAEAGLIGALVLYGVGTEQAIVVAILYRVLTYWLPLLPGALAFAIASRRSYI